MELPTDETSLRQRGSCLSVLAFMRYLYSWLVVAPFTSTDHTPPPSEDNGLAVLEKPLNVPLTATLDALGAQTRKVTPLLPGTLYGIEPQPGRDEGAAREESGLLTTAKKSSPTMNDR